MSGSAVEEVGTFHAGNRGWLVEAGNVLAQMGRVAAFLEECDLRCDRSIESLGSKVKGE